MSERIEIDVRHVTRVEGHGNVRVRATDGVIEEVRWEIPEAPRFFEAMCRGRSWEDVQTVVSRICGICSVTHSLAAIKAIEAAFGTEDSPQTDKLRILTHYGEQIESHVLHVGYLVSPDLLGVKSVIPLASSHAEVVKTVIALHRLGNEIMETLAGRKTHPIRLKPGGFAKLPSEKQLEQMRVDLQASVPRLEQLTAVIADLVGELPDFERETEYVALVNPPSYPFYHGKIGSSDIEGSVSVDEFEKVVNEFPVDEVDNMPANSYFIVMTHNHQLDQELTEAILKRGDFDYYGLIGSQTKRKKFEHRLKAKGFSAEQLERMTCPMGIAEVKGKLPAEIAVSVAGEVISKYNAAFGSNKNQTPDETQVVERLAV